MRRITQLAVSVLVVTAAGCSRLPVPVPGPGELTCRQVDSDSTLSLTWIEANDARSRAVLPSWCATVGPVVYDPRPAAAPPHAFNNTLVVISWNVHVGAGDVDDLIRRLKRGEFTAGEPVTDFVLLLQEVHRRGHGVPPKLARGFPVPHRIERASRQHDDDVRAIAREHGLALLYAPTMRNGESPIDPEDRGNAIVSTIALRDAQVLELPLAHQRRVVPMATIGGQTGDAPWSLRIASVHFDTALAISHGGPFDTRRRQADAVIAALAPSAIPTLVGGDFNTWLGDREPAIAALRRAFPATPKTTRGATWRGALGLRATLDHVFVRGAVQSVNVRRLPSRFGSDHYPLLAVIRF